MRACVRACTGGYCAAPRVAGGTTRNTVAWAAQCRPSLHTTPQHLSPPDFFPRTACLPCSCRCLQSSGSYHLKNGLGPTQHTFFLLYHFFSFILAPRKGLGLKKSSKLEPFCTIKNHFVFGVGNSGLTKVQIHYQSDTPPQCRQALARRHVRSTLKALCWTLRTSTSTGSWSVSLSTSTPRPCSSGPPGISVGGGGQTGAGAALKAAGCSPRCSPRTRGAGLATWPKRWDGRGACPPAQR